MELSIKKKAKRYDEIIKRANGEYAKFEGMKQGDVLEDIFPELKESEDELTWLTKYIEEEAYSLSMDIRDNEDRIKLKKLQKSLAWFEKQGEQKPAWSEEDEKMLHNIENCVHQCVIVIGMVDTVRYIDWLKSLKQRLGG